MRDWDWDWNWDGILVVVVVIVCVVFNSGHFGVSNVQLLGCFDL